MPGKKWSETGRTAWSQDGRRSRLVKDVTGQRFGRVLVLELLPVQRKGYSDSSVYRCQCDCGTVWTVRGRELRRGRISSCGCARREKCCKAPGVSAFNYVFDMIQRGARIRKIPFLLTKAQVGELTLRDCHYCGAAPSKTRVTGNGTYVWNGIDRTNPSGVYEPGNCVPCCEMCNRMKRSYSAVAFVEKAKLIASRQQ